MSPTHTNPTMTTGRPWSARAGTGLARRHRVAGQGRLARRRRAGGRARRGRRRGRADRTGRSRLDDSAWPVVGWSRNSNSVTTPKLPPPAAQTPVQVRVLGRARRGRLAIGGDDRVRLDVVARQAELPGKPAHAATERQPADAGVGDVARRRGQAVRLGRSIEGAKQRTALDRRPSPVRDRRGPRPSATGRSSGRRPGRHRPRTPCPPDCTPISSPASRAWRIAATTSVDRRTSRDERRSAVDHRVPDLAVRVIRRLAGFDELTVEASDDGRVGHRVRPPPGRIRHDHSEPRSVPSMAGVRPTVDAS